MNKSEEIKDLATALSIAQGEIQDATKSSSNPFFKSKYADLAEVIGCIRESFAKNGLSYVQMPSYADEMASVETMLMHKSGQWISSISSAPVTKKDAQGIGSATTYLRRYSLSAVAGITQKDDDGEGAVGRDTKGKPKNIAKINDKQVADLTAIADEVKADMNGFLKFIKVSRIEDIQADKYEYAVKALEAKKGAIMIQGSEEWFTARLGKVTASKISDVLMKPTTAGYRNYRAQLVAERLTNTVAETFTSSAMERGTELEPDARACYEFITGNTVVEVGFVDHPFINNSGASPDGMIGDEKNDFAPGSDIGLVEIKCPNTANHIDYLTSGKAPTQYIKQMQWQMACTGAKWCDFVSYDPRLPESLQVFIVQVERDERQIEEMENAVMAFLKEVDDMVNNLLQISEAA